MSSIVASVESVECLDTPQILVVGGLKASHTFAHNHCRSTLKNRLSAVVYSSSMTNDCWLYAGYKDMLGYSRVFYTLNGRTSYQYVHRVMYENIVGEIPEGLVIDHLCKVRHCINPAHLEPVTVRVNTLRGEGVQVNKRKTHCPVGHEYTEGNTMTTKSGWRRCRECTLLRQRKFYALHKEHWAKYKK